MKEDTMRYRTLSVTIAAILALSACGRGDDAAQGAQITGAQQASVASTTEAEAPLPVAEPEPEPAPVPAIEYVDVTRVRAVTEASPVYGTVVSNTEITREVVQPQRVCRDVVVEERVPERDGLAGGTVAGALVGGALGNQVGKGDGRKLATVAGAIAGGLAGREIDRRHEGGDVVTRTEQQCETQDVGVAEVVGYDVAYRGPDGNVMSKRMESAPDVGARISLGSRSRTIGYDVTYLYRGESYTIRMDDKPGDRLAILDGEVVTGTVAMKR
jgi:uncharacterized protein YcfJ